MKVRVFVAAALAMGVALGTTGCNLLQPQATRVQYDPSDGVGLNLGSIDLENILVISEDGKDGNLLISVANSTGKDVTLRLGFVSGASMAEGAVTVPSNQLAPTSWGADKEERIILGGINTMPGGLLQMAFAADNGEIKTILVPVLNSELPEYKGLAPQNVTTITN